MKTLFKYFTQHSIFLTLLKKLSAGFISGLVFLIPIIIFFQIARWVASFVGGMIPTTNIFLFAFTFFVVTIIGFVMSSFMGGWVRRVVLLFSRKEGVLGHLFNIAIHYKDFSEKTKEAFTKPVYVQVSEGIKQLGFVTDEDVSFVQKTQDKNKRQVAVYIPQPISFLGNLFFVDSDKVEAISPEKAKNATVYLFTAGVLKK